MKLYRNQVTCNIKYKSRTGPNATIGYNSFLGPSRLLKAIILIVTVCNREKIKIGQEKKNLQNRV